MLDELSWIKGAEDFVAVKFVRIRNVLSSLVLFSGRSFLRPAGRDGSAIPPIDLNIAHIGIKNDVMGQKNSTFCLYTI